MHASSVKDGTFVVDELLAPRLTLTKGGSESARACILRMGRIQQLNQ